jgi:hypothetical protein
MAHSSGAIQFRVKEGQEYRDQQGMKNSLGKIAMGSIYYFYFAA